MRTTRRYAPELSVTASKLFPVSSSTARTTTPGNTPPVESVTVPLSAASCANAVMGSHSIAAITARGRNDLGCMRFLQGRGPQGRRYPDETDGDEACRSYHDSGAKSNVQRNGRASVAEA